MLSCHCLNVIVETEPGDFQKVAVETLGLSQEEVEDSFFKQDIQQVGKLININKSHSGLIQTRNVGSWVIHYCINCGVHSHAVHREKGASCILVNAKLFTQESIDKLRAGKSFSKLYKIIIDSDEIVEDDLIANSYLPGEVENVIKGLKQVAADALKNEALAVEERIRHFTDQQYSELSNLREKTFREQQILTKIILNNTLDNSKQPASTNSGMSNPQGMPSRLNEPLAAGSVKFSSPGASTNPSRHTPKRQKSCPIGHHVNSFDTVGLFEFDGTDDIHSGGGSEIEDSDVDDGAKEDGGVKIPKRGGSGNALAKSLPMTIPAFLSQTRNRGFEDVDDATPVERNADIAASIKALAKSVHGDPVFGDLPKPRYTYI
ncbi:lobe protein [Asbolus verrucosus]|uniref:Lobe protein n=1 Tax=Asbolus verrucosus TaxID=1661398 RepID=A0A482W0Q6_ASBVE|nr:lobe protein [Asbolus verrucosus]